MKFLSVLLPVSLAFLSTQASAGPLFYAKVVGQSQGVFKGETTAAHFKGFIPLSGYDLQVVSPRDASSGQASGKREYKPIVITKPVDASTPQLLQALVNNEILTSVTIDSITAEPSGKTSTSVYVITLTNASVAGVTHSVGANGQEVEQISLVFQKIEVKDASITFDDTVLQPVD